MGERLPEVRRRIAAALARARWEYFVEDDELYVCIPGYDGLYGTGDTWDEAGADLAGALAAWLVVRIERGLPIPKEPTIHPSRPEGPPQ